MLINERSDCIVPLRVSSQRNPADTYTLRNLLATSSRRCYLAHGAQANEAVTVFVTRKTSLTKEVTASCRCACQREARNLENHAFQGFDASWAGRPILLILECHFRNFALGFVFDFKQFCRAKAEPSCKKVVGERFAQGVVIHDRIVESLS